jgi:aminopeptidase N
MYFKGALFLHTLRNVMNDDQAWWALVREVYDTYKYRNIMTEDLETLFTARFGREMKPIFDQYLRHAEIPELQLQFDRETAQVRFRWESAVPEFAMPIRVGNPAAWEVVTPTPQWQSRPWHGAPDDFQVATDLYYIKVQR